MTAYKITNLVINGDGGGDIAARIMSDVFCCDNVSQLENYLRQSTVLEVEHFNFIVVPSVRWTLCGLFNGEVNDVYRRGEFPLGDLSTLSITRRVKALCGFTGLKCRREEYGDSVGFKPYGLLQKAYYEVVYP